MNVYRNNGESLVGHNVSPTVLYELTAPEVPESARTEAAEHDSLTVKQSKELVEAHKEIERLKSVQPESSLSFEPDLKKLIPGITLLLESGAIVRERALLLSTLDIERQNIYLSEYESKEFHKKQADIVRLRLQKIESAPAPKPEIIEREKIVEKLPDGFEAREKEVDTKDRQAIKILKTVKQLQKEKDEAEAKLREIHKARTELERKIKKLEARDNISTPSSIDNSRAVKLGRASKELDWIFPDIMNEVKIAGGEMNESKKMIIEIIQKWSALLQDIDGNAIIDI